MTAAQVVLLMWAAGTCGAWPSAWLDPDMNATNVRALGATATPWRIAIFAWLSATLWAALWPIVTLYVVYRMLGGRSLSSKGT